KPRPRPTPKPPVAKPRVTPKSAAPSPGAGAVKDRFDAFYDDQNKLNVDFQLSLDREDGGEILPDEFGLIDEIDYTPKKPHVREPASAPEPTLPAEPIPPPPAPVPKPEPKRVESPAPPGVRRPLHVPSVAEALRAAARPLPFPPTDSDLEIRAQI